MNYNVILLILMLFFAQIGCCQTKTFLSLDELILLALQNNPGLKASNYQIDYNKTLQQSATDIGKTNVSMLYGQYNSINSDNSISINQNIPFPTVILSQAKLHRALTKSSQIKLQSKQNELIYRVKSNFYHLQYLKSSKKLLNSQDSIYTGFLKASQLRVKAAESNILEQISAQSQLLEVQNLIIQNASQIRIYMSGLESLINSKNSFEIEEQNISKLESVIMLDSLDFRENPDLSYLKHQIEIGYRQKKLEASRLMPDITIGYFNQSLIGYQNINGSDQYFDASKRFSGLQLGISVPVWFVPQKGKIKAASINQKIVQNQYEQYNLDIQAEYSQAKEKFLTSKNTIEYYEKNALQAASLLIKQALIGFKNGEIGYLEYLMALKNALTIKTNYLQALDQYNQNIITLEWLSGQNITK